MINSNMLSGGNGKDVQSNAVCVHDTCVKLKTVGINLGIIALAMERYTINCYTCSLAKQFTHLLSAYE